MIDTHCHLNDPQFASDLDDVFSRGQEAGITHYLVPGYNHKSCLRALDIAGGRVWIALGLHPHDAGSVADNAGWISDLRSQILSSSRSAAVGEIGLDFHYMHSPIEVQEKIFRLQIRLAHELNLPTTIHSRAAEDRVMDILREETPPVAGAVLHAFTGSMAQAERAMEMGLYIGVTGIITFKKSDELRRVIGSLPLHRILLETDAPYLAPMPYRGKRNEPGYLIYVRALLSELLQVSEAEVEKHTTENALLVFQRMTGESQ